MSHALHESLFDAIDQREPAKVQAALRGGASACAPHPFHEATPLAWALRGRAPDLDVIKALIDAGARVEPGHLLKTAQRPCPQAFALLASLAGPEAFRGRQDDGSALAHLLGRKDEHEPLLRLALERGADPNAPWRDTYAPLDMAIESCAARCAQTLLSHGADASGIAGQLETPLVRALRRVDEGERWIELARAFIEHPQTDLDRPDATGPTFLKPWGLAAPICEPKCPEASRHPWSPPAEGASIACAASRAKRPVARENPPTTGATGRCSPPATASLPP